MLFINDFNWSMFDEDRKMIRIMIKKKKVNLTNIAEVIKFLQENDTLYDLAPEYLRFVMLILENPATSCTNERSFSLLKRVKSY